MIARRLLIDCRLRNSGEDDAIDPLGGGVRPNKRVGLVGDDERVPFVAKTNLLLPLLDLRTNFYSFPDPIGSNRVQSSRVRMDDAEGVPSIELPG